MPAVLWTAAFKGATARSSSGDTSLASTVSAARILRDLMPTAAWIATFKMHFPGPITPCPRTRCKTMETSSSGGSFTIVDGVGRSNFASALASRRNATGAPQRAGRGVPLSGTVKWRRDTITESPTVESARDEWHQLPSESTAGQLRFGAGRSWRVRGSRCENQRGFAGSGCSGPK